MMSWSESYAKESNRHFKRFAGICLIQGWVAMPATEWTLMRFATFRSVTSRVIGTSLQVELYGIRQVHMACGRPIQIGARDMPQLGRLMTGLRRRRPAGSSRVRKNPITSPVLAGLLQPLDKRFYDNQTIRAMMCFAKFGMLRVSEYTTGPNGEIPRVRDLRFLPNMEKEAHTMVFYFYHSKTNQFKKKERVVCICQCPGPCAVHEVIEMLNRRKTVQGDQFLFRFKNGKIPKPADMNRILKDLCKMVGLQPKQFSSHGFRSGGISDLLAMGVSDQVTQLMSRHANLDSLKPYKKLTDERVSCVLSRFKEAELIFNTVIPPQGCTGPRN